MEKKLTKQEAGKLGAQQTWAKRYETLFELSAYYDKRQQNEFLTWPTKHLVELLKQIKKQTNEPSN